MKPLHEVAVIKDGNEITGFVLGHEKNLVDPKKLSYSHVDVVTMENMVGLVKNNMVQYFVWDKSKDRLSIQYTQEELEVIKKIGGKSGLNLIKSSSTLKDFIRNDIVLKHKHVEMVGRKIGVAGALAHNMKMPFGINVYGIILIGDDNFGSMLSNWIANQDKNIRAQINPMYIQRNNASIAISEKIYTKLAYALNICTNVSTVERDKPSGIRGMMYSSQSAMTEAYNKIEPLNKKIYEIACQGI